MSAPDHSSLPLPDYDHLPVAAVAQHIRSLTADEVSQLLDYEREHANRPAVVQAIRLRLSELAAGAKPSDGGQQRGPEWPEPPSAGWPASPAGTAPPAFPPAARNSRPAGPPEGEPAGPPKGVTTAQPDSGIRVPLLRQAWRTVTFVHWRYPGPLLQRLMPSGLTVEEYDGSAWLTLTPLQMRDVRLAATPAVPGMSAFAETNLRTYVRGPGGRPGVWFFSLDAARAWITIGARLILGAPYFRAKLDITAADGGVRYTGARKGRTAAAYRLHVRPGPKIDPADLDRWLTHRWRAYTRHAGHLLEIPVRHEPWPLQTATVTMINESLTAAAGLPAPAGAALAHYSAGVAGVAFGAPRPTQG